MASRPVLTGRKVCLLVVFALALFVPTFAAGKAAPTQAAPAEVAPGKPTPADPVAATETDPVATAPPVATPASAAAATPAATETADPAATESAAPAGPVPAAAAEPVKEAEAVPDARDFYELDDELDDEDFMDDFGLSPPAPAAAPADSKAAAPKFTGTDLSLTGNCSKEIGVHCKDLTPGREAVLGCLVKRVKAERAGEDDKGSPVSESCKLEIRAFKIAMYKDMTMDVKMVEACKTDVTKYCNDSFLYPEAGNVLACLREVNLVDPLTDACKAEILRAKEDAADDFALDPQLNELCSSDAEKLCSGVQPGGGRIQDCLREHRQKLGWDCQAELFRQEVENVADIRLNVRLFKACLNDKKKFCADVAPGDARVKDCLEEHHLDPDFSPQCKTEFGKMMERRATDFRLDSTLRKYCKGDINEICYPDAEDTSEVANWDAKVLQCLQDYRDELKDPKCRQQVRQLTKRSAEDIRFDRPLADACHEDRTSICKKVPDGMAQVFRCLQDNRDKLKEMCRSALFEQEVRMAEDFDFKFPMKQACTEEKVRFCPAVTQGHAAVIKCLADHLKEADMGVQCSKEIQRDQQRSAEDYRLNYRLNKACFNDVKKMCMNVCDKAADAGSATCGGSVLECLSANKTKLSSEACKKEVFSFEKQEVSDISLDIPLQNACKHDVDSFCKKVPMDHQRTLACLRVNRDNLTKDCKEEELRFSMMEASDIRLTPTLMNACGQELQAFCKDVPPTEGQAFKCLQSHLGEVGMGAACVGEVNLQEARHSSDYRLDIRLRKECATDVETLCGAVDKTSEGHALVLKCFVNQYKKLTASCATEVSYAVRMALWEYTKGAELTKPCDEVIDSPDVAKVCQLEDAKPLNGAVVAVYGQCLLAQPLPALPKECKRLVKVVLRNSAHVGGKIDDSKLQETIDKLAALQSTSGGGSGVGLVLSGWTALFALLSLFVVIVGGAAAVYYQKFDPRRNYTMVTKSGDV